MYVSSALLPNPLIVSKDTSLLQFVQGVLDSNQTTAVVLDDAQHLLGVVSIHDILRRVLPAYVDMDDNLVGVIREGYFEEKFAEFANIPIANIMSTKVDCLSPGDTVMQAVDFFVRKQHKTIPVIENGKFVGTITRRSLLRRVTSPSV